MLSDPPAPPRRSRLNPLQHAPFMKHEATGVVVDAEMVTPTMRRLRIASPEVCRKPYRPGQHVRIEIIDPISLQGVFRPSDTLRTYTVWDRSTSDATIDVLVHLYDGEGIGRRWAGSVRPGEPVRLWGPLGDFTLDDDAPWSLFAGEETAGAAFGPMLRALGPEAEVHGVLESETPDDEVPTPGEHALERVHRHGHTPVRSATLLQALEDLRLPTTPGVAYLAGEARTVQAARDLLLARGWSKERIRLKPFWAVGKRGLH